MKKERKASDYSGWLLRPASHFILGIDRFKIYIRDSFSDLFEDYCNEKNIEYQREKEIDATNQITFYLRLEQSDDYDSLIEQLADLPYEFADFLKEKYGDKDPRGAR